MCTRLIKRNAIYYFYPQIPLALTDHFDRQKHVCSFCSLRVAKPCLWPAGHSDYAPGLRHLTAICIRSFS